MMEEVVLKLQKRSEEYFDKVEAQGPNLNNLTLGAVAIALAEVAKCLMQNDGKGPQGTGE